jgi:SAM-dependent methyltransferase
VARLARERPPPRLLIGADFSRVALEAAARRFTATELRWDLEDVQALTYSDASFDTVVSCETVEHLPDPQRAVGELARVLRPGGRLFLTTPNYLGLLGLYRGYLRLRGRRFTEVGQPINRLTLLPRTWFWLRKAGLRLECWDAVGHYLPWPGRPPIALPLDAASPLRPFALHSIFVAIKSLGR